MIRVRFHWLKLLYHIGIGHPLKNPHAGKSKHCSAFGGFPAAAFLDEEDKISVGKAKGSTAPLHSGAGKGAGAAKATQLLPPTTESGYF